MLYVYAVRIKFLLNIYLLNDCRIVNALKMMKIYYLPIFGIRTKCLLLEAHVT